MVNQEERDEAAYDCRQLSCGHRSQGMSMATLHLWGVGGFLVFAAGITQAAVLYDEAYGSNITEGKNRYWVYSPTMVYFGLQFLLSAVELMMIGRSIKGRTMFENLFNRNPDVDTAPWSGWLGLVAGMAGLMGIFFWTAEKHGDSLPGADRPTVSSTGAWLMVCGVILQIFAIYFSRRLRYPPSMNSAGEARPMVEPKSKNTPGVHLLLNGSGSGI